MRRRIGLQARIDDYLAERHRLGFELHSRDTLLASFAGYVASRHHRGPLTVELMANWARCDKGNRGTPGTWARRLALLRHFARYLKQFEPDTEVPVSGALNFDEFWRFEIHGQSVPQSDGNHASIWSFMR